MVKIVRNTLFVFFINILVSSDLIDSNISYFYDKRIESTVLHLDYIPLNKSSFLLNKYFPNHSDDFNVYGIMIDGSMRLPIYQMIPEKIYFDHESEGTFSQLSYKNKKSEEYYNTKVALKTDLKEDLRFLTLLESKSYDVNINQNHLFNLYKTDNNRLFNFSYMYHLDDANVEYYSGESLSPEVMFDNLSQFNRYHESFHLGLSYNYINDNYEYKHSLYNQVSNITNNLTEKELDAKFHWYNNSIKYHLSDIYDFFIDSYYKKINIEDSNSNEEGVMSQHQYIYGFNINLYDSYFIKLGNAVLRNNSTTENYLDFTFAYKKNNYKLEISRSNNVKSNMYNYTYNCFNIQKTSFSFDLLLNRFKHKVEAGEILLDYFNEQNPEYFDTSLPKYKKYNFVSSEGALDFKWISLDYNYQFNDSPLTFINTYFTTSITISPKVKNARYRPYGKISNILTSINETYEIDIRDDDLFVFDSDDLKPQRDVNAMIAEIGIVLNSFKISYILSNPFNDKVSDEVHYSPKMLPLLGRYSYLDIIWIFND